MPRRTSVLVSCAAGLFVGGCRNTSTAPHYAYDGSYDGTVVIPGPRPDASSDSGSGFDAGDAGSFDGGVARCGVQLASDLVDDANATGAGLDLVSRTNDFVVAFAYGDPTLPLANNVYARTVATDGSLGLANSYVLTDQSVTNPALVALTSSAGAKTGDLVLAWEQTFPIGIGTVEQDLVGVDVDATLAAPGYPVQLTPTDGIDATLPAAAPLPALASRFVFASTATGAPTVQTISLSGGVASTPADVNTTLGIVGTPAIARVSSGAVAVYHASNGSIVTASVTESTVGGTNVVGTSSLGAVVSIDGDDTVAAVTYEDEASTGRPTVRFVPLNAVGVATSSPAEITPSPIVAHAPAIALLGTSRLVVYRGVVGGAVSLRAAFLDANGSVLSDQAITDASLQGVVRVAAVSATTALAVFEEPASGGTVAAPGYRVRAAVLVCQP